MCSVFNNVPISHNQDTIKASVHLFTELVVSSKICKVQNYLLA